MSYQNRNNGGSGYILVFNILILFGILFFLGYAIGLGFSASQ